MGIIKSALFLRRKRERGETRRETDRDRDSKTEREMSLIMKIQQLIYVKQRYIRRHLAVICATKQNTRRVCYTVCFLKNHVFMYVITSVNTLQGIELLVYISKCVPLYSNCNFLNTNLGLYFKLPPATLKKILYIFQEFCTKLYI